MPVKTSGKESAVIFDGKEYPILDVNYDQSVDLKDATDNASGEGYETIIGRGKRSGKLTMNLYKADGAEVATGTLTKDTKYRVTLGTIAEGVASYSVGRIFRSDGSGSASSTNKVAPLGVVFSGKTIAMTVAGTTVPITDASYKAAYDTKDATDSSSPVDSQEFLVGRVKYDGSLTALIRKDVADLIEANPTQQAVVFTLDTGATITGNAQFTKKSVDGKASSGDAVEAKYDFQFQGVPTEVLPNQLALGVAKTLKIIFGKGSSIDKSYSGTAYLTGKTIDMKPKDADKITVTYDFVYSGSVTPTVAN